MSKWRGNKMSETLIISLMAGTITFAIGFAIGRNQRQKNLPKSRKPIKITPDQVMADDPNAAAIISQAFNAPPGTCVTGHVDDSGKLHTEEFKIDSIAGCPDQSREGEA